MTHLPYSPTITPAELRQLRPADLRAWILEAEARIHALEHDLAAARRGRMAADDVEPDVRDAGGTARKARDCRCHSRRLLTQFWSLMGRQMLEELERAGEVSTMHWRSCLHQIHAEVRDAA